MTTSVPPRMLPHLWKSAVVSGLLAVALGVGIVAWPGISIAIAAIFFSAGLLVYGIHQVFLALSLHVSLGGRLLLFISGLVLLVLAVLAFLHLSNAVLLLAIWIGMGFIFRGVATTVSAISDPTLPGRFLTILVGVISLIAGVVVLGAPFDSIGTLAFVVGIWLIVIGVMEIVASIAIRKAMQKGSDASESTEDEVTVGDPTATELTSGAVEAEPSKTEDATT